MHCVILAGGAGTRFWPKSRRQQPKQLLDLVNGKSLLYQTVKRLSQYQNCEGIYLVASDFLVDLSKEKAPDIPAENYFIEPSGRNTAPAIALAAFMLHNRFGNDAVMGVFPADHLIRKEKEFHTALSLAHAKALEGQNLITLGIQPTYPATGYGYVEFNRKDDGDIHEVVRFTEKPDLETAKGFLEGGAHLWNGGMFVWKVDTIMENLARHLPQTYKQLESIQGLIDTPKFTKAIEKVWPEVDSISIDYGVLERAKSIFTAETRFEWHDLGTWRTLYNVLPKDNHGNITQGDAVMLDCSDSLVISENRYTAVIGVKDLIVVSTDDATIVMPKSESERVQEIVQRLKSEKRDHLL